ncbi:MAG: glycosyltransferase family 4 protein [Leptolyngbyaceae cyanobacterium RU_5_1]|nr:glycosyltransferase family 4 protein [Leptolyngbyaceae cyanobacterium RU_5_1]
MKVALVHDYLTQRGGAERVFELLCRYYPEADIFTSLYDPEHTIDLSDRVVQTTVLQKIPGAAKHFRLLAPLYFPVFRSLDLRDYDLIISSSSSFAKAVRKRPDARHICFCHNITRFLWDTPTYLREYTAYRRFYPLLENIFQLLRQMDLKYSREPDLYIANSSVVADRIRSTYNKPVIVINYPIDSNQFVFSEHKDNFYLVSTRLISYKRTDVIIEAFNWLGLPLFVMGDGPERQRLQAQAMDNIRFLGHVNDEERTQLMSRTRAVIVAALEDYGLVPVEANASGTPVIAYGAGGVLDTQISEQTGVLFDRQTPESLQAALLRANRIDWNYQQIRNHALKHFSEDAFFKKVDQVLGEVYS